MLRYQRILWRKEKSKQERRRRIGNDENCSFCLKMGSKSNYHGMSDKTEGKEIPMWIRRYVIIETGNRPTDKKGTKALLISMIMGGK
jgi:hypothetical protein